MSSGDLVNKGGKDFDDILSAFTSFELHFIDPISTGIGLPKNRFFFCPGNHDIDRNADTKVNELGLRALLVDAAALRKFMSSGDSDGLQRVAGFKEFEKYFHSSYPGSVSLTDHYQSSFVLELEDGRKVGLTSFNSAWRCYNSDTDKKALLLGEMQIVEARKALSDCAIKIAIVHHPLDWLADFDYKTINAFVAKDYDMLFCGHVHEGTAWSTTNRYGNLFVSVASANWVYDIRKSDGFCNGYSVIDYDFVDSRITVHHRRYSYLNERYDPDTELGDTDGIFTITIPTSVQLTKEAYQQRLAETMESMHSQEFNEHLLTFNTDTHAPKTVDALFVLPSIVKKVTYDVQKKQEEISYTLNDLSATSTNTLLFGIQESGKTTLLHKLFLELARKSLKYNKIPVLIDFDEIGGKTLETLINNSLGVGLRSLKSFLKDNQIVLLIDDIIFDEGHRHLLSKLEQFIARNPSVQIIATSKEATEGVIPTDFLEYPDQVLNFAIANIKSFRTEQIRELIRKWFADNVAFDIPDRVDKVFKLVTTLNLPATPLAISMFLWIIEQQENYKPINHASVLETFVERLFKKSSKKQFYSEKFDYKNKEHLLAEIAYRMYQAGDDNYRMPYQGLLAFIADNLKVKKFDFNAEDLLEHFIAKGILVKEHDGTESCVRFHFPCFLEYFLMKQMSFDPDFLSFVLEGDNFLKFPNEIDYYTGLKRDQTDILRILIDRMNETYKKHIDQILKFQYGFDEVFMTARPVELREDFLVKIKEKGKPKQEEIDKIKDEMLEKLRPEKGIMKKEDLTPFAKLERVWTLTARVLKNTEETKIPGLKDEAYESVLRCGATFGVLYKMYIEEYLSKKVGSGKKAEELFLVHRDVIPLIVQVILQLVMGTGKLSMVIRDKIVKDRSNSVVSEFERFISVFLYADIRGKDYRQYITEFAKSFKRYYIVYMTLFKVLTYYYFRANNADDDHFYESLLAELYIHSKGLNKVEKGKIMQQYSAIRKKERAKQKRLASSTPAEETRGKVSQCEPERRPA